VEERLRLFLQVCEAVEYAHGRRIVHRDLKPANILVTPEGEVRLLDFGIAKVLDEEMESASTVTRWGGVPMTPSYASPEQFTGEPIGYGSDVYQLGAILYQLLTGCTPHTLEDLGPAEVRRLVAEVEPLPPSRRIQTGSRAAVETAEARGTEPTELRARLTGALDRIVLQALMRDPDQRYPSVTALATDLRRHLSGLAVSARRPSPWHRVRHAFASHRSGALGLGAVLVIGSALFLGGGLRPEPPEETAGSVIPAASSLRGLTEFGATSTSSQVAHRFFQEGLDAHYRGASSLAFSLFEAAVREDSTFAMAWFYLGRTTPVWGDEFHYKRTARELAQVHGRELERLLIEAWWAEWTDDPSLRAFADSLVALYPDEAEGHLLLGILHLRRGEYGAALPHFETVATLDSESLLGGGSFCLSCDALNQIVITHVDADSLPAAEAAARRWVGLQPHSATAWERLAWTLWRQGRGEEALQARLEATQRRAATASDQVYAGVVAIRMGDFPEADAVLSERARNGTREVQEQALWWTVVSLRYQRRLGEALEAARRYRALRDAGDQQRAVWDHVAPEAQVLFEMGRHSESLALMDSAAAQPFGSGSASRDTRHRVWVLSHASTVALAMGDTARVRRMADEMEALAQDLARARDQALHLYPRALLDAERGNLEAAAVGLREVTATNRYARGNLDLARVLLRMGHPGEAIGPLQRALRGPIQSDGYYIIGPEFHEALGRAWEDLGAPDSAAVHYRKALAAWEGADPFFDDEIRELERRLATVEF
jgi:tetratricopeptide (TPR) repeat protein